MFETYVEPLLAPALPPGQVVVKNNLGAHRPKRIGARTKEVLIEPMGRAFAAAVRVQDVRGFFVHCGHRTPAQQL
jgi:hypothetical protein